VAVTLAAWSVGLFALALAPLFWLRSVSSTSLEPFRVSTSALSGWFDAGDFVLQTAAAENGRMALARAASAQTTLALAALLAAGVYFFWRGFTNFRLRGWTQAYWIGGLALILIAPAFMPKLSAARVDYAATFWLGVNVPRGGSFREALVQPAVILMARAVFAGALAALAGLFAHDLAHRMREALWEMGLVDDEDDHSRRVEDNGTQARRRETRGPGTERNFAEEDGGFGQRRGGPRPLDDRAWAFAALGLRVGAGRAEIERAYRERIKRAHPDHGGSVERAARLNQARDVLLPHGRR